MLHWNSHSGAYILCSLLLTTGTTKMCVTMAKYHNLLEQVICSKSGGLRVFWFTRPSAPDNLMTESRLDIRRSKNRSKLWHRWCNSNLLDFNGFEGRQTDSAASPRLSLQVATSQGWSVIALHNFTSSTCGGLLLVSYKLTLHLQQVHFYFCNVKDCVGLGIHWPGNKPNTKIPRRSELQPYADWDCTLRYTCTGHENGVLWVYFDPNSAKNMRSCEQTAGSIKSNSERRWEKGHRYDAKWENLHSLDFDIKRR